MRALSALLMMVDGARYDVFGRLLNENALPNIQEHIVARGTYTRMTSVFTTTTGPAYVPFLTGCLPGTANIPGIRWMDKKAYAERSVFYPYRNRSYCGWENFFINRDLRADMPTLFELVNNPMNIFGPITRGLPKKNNKRAWRRSYALSKAHHRVTYEQADALALQTLLESLREESEFRFAVFHAVDGLSHNLHPEHERVLGAYRFVDNAVGLIAAELKKQNRYDATLLALCSDHGLTATHTHWDVASFFEKELNLKTLYYPKIFRRRPEAAVHISGNSMAHVYFKNHDWAKPCYYEEIIAMPGDRINCLLKQDAVDIILTKTRDGRIRADSRRGAALLSEQDGHIHYAPIGSDPFGFDPMPDTMSFYETLERTYDTDYPDALLQAAQIFRSPRCGDLLISAAPGHDLRDRWEIPEHHASHGSLYKAHILTPFCISRPIQPRLLRSADVMPSLLQLLGKSIPERLDGRSFFAP